MKKKSNILILTIILLLVGAGFVYWYLFFYGPGNTVTPVVTGTRPTNGFTPFTSSGPDTRNGTSSTSNGDNNGNGVQASPTPIVNEGTPIPSLRLLSTTPIGGYGASTTASTTIIRWVDRGRGNIFETKGNSLETVSLSNTILPRMYESVWNKNLTAFIGSLLPSNADIPTVVYAELKIQPKKIIEATSSSDTLLNNQTPFELKGKNLPENMLAYAVSPKGDKIFMLIKENGSGSGYISNFDGTSVVRIFTTPLTQVNVEWPENSTIAITTKGSASHSGFLYFVDTKTGVWKKVLGPIFGLSTKVSHDVKYILASGASQSQMITTNIYAVGTTTPTETTIKTIADKCTWGNFYKEFVYCATPTQVDSATYPDDWYRGNVSFSDKIWQINAKNSDTHLVTSIIDQSDRLIDAFNLGLNAKDNFLYFMNKNDLSFWSFDLSAR